jgi:putative transcriptional regulator
MFRGTTMSSRRYASLFCFAAGLAAAMSINVAPSGTAAIPAQASFAGQVLIASPALSDPNFAGTVVLMVQHDRRGAFGIVINRALGERPIKRLLHAFGDKDAAVEGQVLIVAGGPVQPELGFVVHSADYRRPETIDIDGRLAVTSSRDILRDIGENKGPQKILVALGYAGWGPGQLEGEMAQKAWFTAPADPKLVFDDARDKVWDNAMARRAVDL